MAHRILTPEEASAIQTKLNEVAHAQLVVDGHFGTLSQQALMRFQAEHNITPADGNPSQPTLDALGIPNLFSPPPKLTPNPVVQAIGSVVINLILNQFLKGTGITMDFSRIAKAIAAAISGAGIGGGASAYTYVSLPPEALAALPHWVAVGVPLINMGIGAVVAFIIVYRAPANTPA